MYSFNAGNVPTSVEVIKNIFERKMLMLAKFNMACIDVRDVATAHVRAMTSPKAAGNRHILAHTHHWMHEIGQILAQEFTPQGYFPTTVDATSLINETSP